MKKSLSICYVALASLSLVFFVSSTYAQTTGSLSFSPDSVARQTGEVFTTDIIVDTGGTDAIGTGAKISYDPTRLEAVSIEKGVIFGDYPLTVIDSETGTITISGIAASKQYLFNGRGVFATVTWRGLEAGQTNASFEFELGNTRDSNIAVLTGNFDSLGAVRQLSVNLSGPVVEPTNTAATTGTTDTSVNPVPTPNTTTQTTANTTQTNQASIPATSEKETNIVQKFFKAIGGVLGRADNDKPSSVEKTGFGGLSEPEILVTTPQTEEELREQELYGPITASQPKTQLTPEDVVTDVTTSKVQNQSPIIALAIAILIIAGISGGVALIFWQRKHRGPNGVIRL